MLDGATCRPQTVRRYFGEGEAGPCGVCDLCQDPPARFDATVQAQKALAAVQRLGERLGRGRVIDHLLGKTKDVQPWETALSTWGIGADTAQPAWRDVLDHLMFEGLLVENPNEGKPLVMLGDLAGDRPRRTGRPRKARAYTGRRSDQIGPVWPGRTGRPGPAGGVTEARTAFRW